MTLTSVDHLRLPLQFDPVRLRLDLGRIQEPDWISHFNTDYYEGDWSGVALRGVAGATHPIQALYPNPTATEFADTLVLGRCPYFAEVLARFECTVKSARLLRLRAGSVTKEHTDYNLGLEDGEVRIHVPVVTSPDVEFVLHGERIVMQEGEAWYVNVNRPHRVANHGAIDRIHLVADCVVNDWIKGLFERAAQRAG